MEINERLSSAILDASKRAANIEARAKRTRFTSETATAANAKKYADKPRKPKTATVRVESDIIELIKVWPTPVRVRLVSEAIRGAIKAYEAIDRIKTDRERSLHNRTSAT